MPLSQAQLIIARDKIEHPAWFRSFVLGAVENLDLGSRVASLSFQGNSSSSVRARRPNEHGTGCHGALLERAPKGVGRQIPGLRQTYSAAMGGAHEGTYAGHLLVVRKMSTYY